MIKPKSITALHGYEVAGVCEKVTLQTLNPERIWQQFMPQVKHLTAFRADQNLYAIQDFRSIPGSPASDPIAPFDFWAAVRIQPDIDTSAFPEVIQRLYVPNGTYAVFIHKGPASAIQQTMNAIFTEWLPDSGYAFDNTLQFQVMTADYKGPLDPEAEEEVWIPVKKSIPS